MLLQNQVLSVKGCFEIAKHRVLVKSSSGILQPDRNVMVGARISGAFVCSTRSVNECTRDIGTNLQAAIYQARLDQHTMSEKLPRFCLEHTETR